MARNLGQDAGETFKDLCEHLLTCNLKETYLEVEKSLEEFINEKPDKQFLSFWLSWWDNRRTFHLQYICSDPRATDELGRGNPCRVGS